MRASVTENALRGGNTQSAIMREIGKIDFNKYVRIVEIFCRSNAVQ